MAVNPMDAISAYKQGGGMGDLMGGASTSSTNAPGSGQSFSDMLSGAMGDAIGSLHAGESAAIAQASGKKTDMASVVTAMDNAEVILDEVTAIRDKVISAYQAITSGAI